MIEANSQPDIRGKYCGKKDSRLRSYIQQGDEKKWYKIEGDYLVIRATKKFPVVKVNFNCLTPKVKELIKNDSRKSKCLSNTTIALEKKTDEPKKVDELKTEDKSVENEYKVLDYLGPEVLVPPPADDPKDEPENVFDL